MAANHKLSTANVADANVHDAKATQLLGNHVPYAADKQSKLDHATMHKEWQLDPCVDDMPSQKDVAWMARAEEEGEEILRSATIFVMAPGVGVDATEAQVHASSQHPLLAAWR